MALERRDQRDAVLLPVGRGAVQLCLRPHHGGFASHCRRYSVGRVAFRFQTALNQTWTRELRNQVLDAQRMAPSPASALFVAKVLANFLFVTMIQVVLGPLFIIFYNLHALGQGWWMAAVLPLGTLALVVNGTFFAALSLRTRNREMLLPLILFPVSIPALLAMVQSTSAI